MNRLLLIAALIICLFSCSEDKIEVSYKDATIPFVPASDDHSEEAEIRRTFFNNHGTYLLFSDTLQHIALGKDINGDVQYFTERLDISYEVGTTGSSYSNFSFSSIPSLERKKVAVEYLESYITPHFTGKVAPFSWFMADKITRVHTLTYAVSNPYAAIGQRATAIASNLLPKLSDAQKVQYTRMVINEIIGQIAYNHSDSFSDFFSVSRSKYNGSFPSPETNAENTALLAEQGFICRGTNEWNNETNGAYPNRELDIKAYARLVAAYSLDELRTKYADYPLVIQKCEIAYETLTSLGYRR